MESVESSELGLENRGGSVFDCSSSGIFKPLPSEKVLGVRADSESIYKPWDGVSSYFNVGWDSPVSLARNVETRASPIVSYDRMNCSSYTGMLENQGTNGISHIFQYPFDHSLAELIVPNPPHLGSGNFLDMDSLLDLHKCQQIGNSGRPPDFSSEVIRNEIALSLRSATDNSAQCREGCPISHVGTMKPSPNGKKRKRVVDDGSQFAQLKENDGFTGEQNGEKCQPKQKPIANLHGKHVPKELKDSSDSKETPKEDYVHVRAKRGQATNNHSIAERLRRERISERMKFLQDLVPGCNKITGKAVMLDEIINYVLSLQRQVEFLSMKLAMVYPETNRDIEHILSRNIHHSQDGSAAILGDQGGSSFYHIRNEISRGAFTATESSDVELPSMPQASIWHSELLSTSQMDYISNPSS